MNSDWASSIFLFAITAAGITWYSHRKGVQRRIERAFDVGKDVGHFQGWIARANRHPITHLPPTMADIDDAREWRHGWNDFVEDWDSFYGYLHLAVLCDDSSIEEIQSNEWMERKVKKINKMYLYASRGTGRDKSGDETGSG